MNGQSRRVTLAVTAISLISGIAAAWFVSDLLSAQDRRNGPLVRVLVAAAPIARGTRIDDVVLTEAVVGRNIPRAFLPAGGVKSTRELLGAVVAADIPTGAYLTANDVSPAGSVAGSGFELRRGERAVTVDALVAPDGANLSPGIQIDLLASGIGGGSATELVIARAEVLAIGDLAGEPAERDTRITLRVSVEQVPAVIRADTFAKEVRAVVVP